MRWSNCWPTPGDANGTRQRVCSELVGPTTSNISGLNLFCIGRRRKFITWRSLVGSCFWSYLHVLKHSFRRSCPGLVPRIPFVRVIYLFDHIQGSSSTPFTRRNGTTSWFCSSVLRNWLALFGAHGMKRLTRSKAEGKRWRSAQIKGQSWWGPRRILCRKP